MKWNIHTSSQKVNWQKDQNPGLLVILLLGILFVHDQQLLPVPVEEGDVHVPHQHPFRHSALGSSEPRHMLLTELILCVLAVILHKTVVFDRNKLCYLKYGWLWVRSNIFLSVHHQQLLPGDEDVYASVPNQQPFLDPRNLLLYNIPILARLLALPALHDGGGGGYQTQHNHGLLSQGDPHQQLHLGGLREGEYGMAIMV